MIYRLLADVVVLLHFVFILFIFGGGLLVLRWRKLVWVHLPLAIWGIVVEFGSFICPLTHLENYLRDLGGESSYTIDFVEQYIVPFVYPAQLNFRLQLVLGTLVLLVNVMIYGFVVWKSWKRKET